MASGTRNWAGNVVFGAKRFHTPSSVAELQELVAGSAAVRALGSGHSFNTIADTSGDLVSVAGLPRVVDIDAAEGTVTVSAGLRFGEFTGAVHEAGFALHNLGSLPHISVAGACATGTHGSGVGNGSIATAVRAVEFVGADGELVRLARGDEGFEGSVLSLGALGVVTRMTLDLRPTFDVQQWVYDGLPHAQLRGHFDEIMASAYSVSLFTGFRGDRVDQVWIKDRVGADGPRTAPARWFGATLADGPRHPVPGMSPRFSTEQAGVPGPWQARLPHFRLEFTPSSGEELQSEYFVARRDAVAAFGALDRVRDRIAPLLQIAEIRTVAADELWLSPSRHTDTVAFHFTWVPDTAAVLPVLGAIEAALAEFGAVPHWGKVFTTAPEAVAARYERYDDFRRLVRRFDPEGTFHNDFLERFFPRVA